jgi:enoyl-CoA hydratase
MIRSETSGFVTTITLDRPAARNALRITDWNALADAAAAIDAQRRVVILSGGDSFCAGADLTELQLLAHDVSLRVAFRGTMARAIEGIAALPMPVIAAIAGGCFGAGVALANAADIRVAATDARFATTPAKLGIGYPASDVARLIERVGRSRASRMLFAAETIGAAEAQAIGLVDDVADDPQGAARRLADAIAANAPSATRLLKATLLAPNDPAHAAAFDNALGGDDFAKGLAAFHARRRP